MAFMKPKTPAAPAPPPPPPAAPTPANANVQGAAARQGLPGTSGMAGTIMTGGDGGLNKKSQTAGKTLLGQ